MMTIREAVGYVAGKHVTAWDGRSTRTLIVAARYGLLSLLVCVAVASGCSSDPAPAEPAATVASSTNSAASHVPQPSAPAARSPRRKPPTRPVRPATRWLVVFDADPTDTVVDVFRNTTVAAFRERHLSVLVVKADDRPYTTTGPHNRAYQDPGRTRALTQPLGRDGRPSVVLVENDVMIERWVPPIAASVVIERVDSLPAREREVAAKLARMRQRPPRSDRSVLSEPPAGCPTKVNGCLRKYARARMSEKDIEHLYEAGIPECLTKEPLELSRRAQCLPVIMGADARNGNDVELRYFCSDVCPDQGRVNLVYAGLTEEECCNLSAYPMRDPAWGSYEGCIPAGLFRPLQIGYAEDGRKVLMTRDPCTGVSSYVRELRPGEFGSRR